MTRHPMAQKALLILALAAAPQTGHADSTHTNPPRRKAMRRLW